MSDFHQAGAVTTLHRLGPPQPGLLGMQLEEFCRQRPIALVLPALQSEFENPAMSNLLGELAGVRYIRQFIFALGRATPAQFHRAQQRAMQLAGEVRVIWMDGPRVKNLVQHLAAQGIETGAEGKGRSCWLACGYALASSQCRIIALQDCDIVNYSSEMLARLCYPLAHPELGYEFCKGYYARVSSRMYGRATRIFFTPVVRALEGLLGNLPLLRYLDSFRYALAGEFAMSAGLARRTRITGNWGLETGILAEAYRNCPVARICQADLADSYEHKHREVRAANGQQGLACMAGDISKCLLRALWEEGVRLEASLLAALPGQYQQMAEGMVKSYQADALINGLPFDADDEKATAALFAQALQSAAQEFLRDPRAAPLIPSWQSIAEKLPDFPPALLQAVDADNSNLMGGGRRRRAASGK